LIPSQRIIGGKDEEVAIGGGQAHIIILSQEDPGS
jgi:hypothetical protein